tara:strand:- start:5111 stop:6109 length:999 start_codon:yes stop_codon:yes gene_type:complete
MYLVTGGLGFIGLNFVELCLKKKQKVVIVDSMTYAANKNVNYLLKKGVIICNKEIGTNLLPILKRYKITTIINFAAETHVDNSIKDSKKFIDTNINQLVKLFNITKKYLDKLNSRDKKKFRFIQISTDEVFGSLDKKDPEFKETNKYFPNNPYSATKAAGDLLARVWFKTYDLPIITTNCSNNYGKYQNKEKLIPKVIINSIKRKNIPVYGNGKNTREWIHVEDHCNAILILIKKGKIGESYNIGSSSEVENINLIKMICKILDKEMPRKDRQSYMTQISYVKDRKAHDLRYSINSSKIKRATNWKAKIKFKDGLKNTIKHYIAVNRNEFRN